MWQTHLTVAAVIQKGDKFLLVTDKTSQGLKLNQPAGHIEPNEDLISAVIREVKEETSLDFTPEKIVGIYLFHPNPQHTYMRVCFKGSLKDYSLLPTPQPNDDGVIAANWYSVTDIQDKQEHLRSPLVMRCIKDYLQGVEFPLSLIADYREINYSNID